jgi:hypothetical protein
VVDEGGIEVDVTLPLVVGSVGLVMVEVDETFAWKEMKFQ